MQVADRYYVTRSQAAAGAKKAGHEHFQTVKMPQGWRWASMPVPSPAYGYAHDKDFIAWIETHHIDEGRSNGYKGVIIVTVTRDELPTDIPDHIEVQPITPSLWANSADASPQASRGRSPSQSTPREKSDAQSPVKLVWQIADEMVGHDRKVVIEACVSAGVNRSTAGTQYYRWSKARGKS